jgi:SAM-dependent methyltransferase
VERQLAFAKRLVARRRFGTYKVSRFEKVTNMRQHKEHHSALFGLTAEVRDFYERYPYPRPVESLDNYRRLWQDPQRRRADHHLFWPHKPYREEYSILIAGCGTSQAAKHAVRWPEAQVTGIDFSTTSVRCTEELKRTYDLNNLRVSQLPIEEASELGETFDQIVCTGVLHHLTDPDAGLKVLRNVLKPDGVMHLMVYAPYGRTGIYMLQDFCRRLGIHAEDGEIKNLVSALALLPPGHPLENLLREAPDFRHEVALADSLLHPQDRAYSVPELFDFIKRGKMAFGRWIKQAPYSPHCGVMAQIPQASRLIRLPPVEQYATAELFRGTMVRHSVVVYRDDRPAGAQQVSFAGDAWLNYVPIRMPDTICVEDRLPPGSAAVLINQTHTYRDLYMPINEQEKNVYDTIDGKRTIGEIAGRPELYDTVCTFFERLWWHDQVVFDTSQVHWRQS